SDANYIFNGLSIDEIEAITETVLKTNDGVAHLTANQTKDISLQDLALACHAIIKVVNCKLVIPLGLEKIEFSF
ncbi:hypothetical protein AB4574_25815, partial [Vibrio sp. 10N.222.49.E5]